MTGKDNITSLFGKSPISPLQKHMKQVHSCLKEFGVFAKAAETEDWEKSITADAIRLSIIKRLASMDDAELICEVQLEDTIEHEEEVELKWTNQ